mmetsp:Transcript_39320/g.90869  ORF Transcript_39320/g.90869 Transcript_39320/m.90869 type:complete len:215 (+) Transcript_39320:1023-1667(+)
MNLSITSRRTMPMNSSSFKVCPICTSLFVGEIMVILRTCRSTMSVGKLNSSNMQRGMAPPHGLQLSNFLSIKKVSIPALAKVSAAHAPPGPPPTTATRSLRPSTGMRSLLNAARAVLLAAPARRAFLAEPTVKAVATAALVATTRLRHPCCSKNWCSTCCWTTWVTPRNAGACAKDTGAVWAGEVANITILRLRSPLRARVGQRRCLLTSQTAA